MYDCPRQLIKIINPQVQKLYNSKRTKGLNVKFESLKLALKKTQKPSKIIDIHLGTKEHAYNPSIQKAETRELQ